ncbi:hypothetical protein DMUE_4800 [Dictyocoela muelleri]|nr:hypothetical protein DMUE_4800 [Dictyocoela muelleri]
MENSIHDKKDNSECIFERVSAAKSVDNHNARISRVGSQGTFSRNMKDKMVKIEIFMIESEDSFETLSLRSQMTRLVRNGNVDIKNWYYKMGADGTIPSTYDEFKSRFIDFCCGESIEHMIRYRDEPWSKYLDRLRCASKEKNISEDDVFRKLRSDPAPRTLQTIFYSFGVKLSDVIERVIEWENYMSKGNFSKRMPTKNSEKEFLKAKDNTKKLDVRCYKCNEIGHYSIKCKIKKEKLNVVDKKKCYDEKLDTEAIFIQGQRFTAIFDTGASESVITSKILISIPNKNIIE